MDRDGLESLYRTYATGKNAMALHMPTLRALASGCGHVAELGVKRGTSTVALLLGARHVTSIDLVLTPAAARIQTLSGDAWTFLQGDSRTLTLPAVELLLVDSAHTYAQVEAELLAHADKVSHWLVFHDTITFGSIGADGESGRHQWTYQPGASVPLDKLGIRPAIDNLMIRDPSWKISSHDPRSHGLLVLRRA